MLFAWTDDIEREPPVFRIAAFEIDMAGAKILESTVRVLVERFSSFSVDTSIVLGTFRLEET